MHVGAIMNNSDESVKSQQNFANKDIRLISLENSQKS